jgi:hypothetical protein
MGGGEDSVFGTRRLSTRSGVGVQNGDAAVSTSRTAGIGAMMKHGVLTKTPAWLEHVRRPEAVDDAIGRRLGDAEERCELAERLVCTPVRGDPQFWFLQRQTPVLPCESGRPHPAVREGCCRLVDHLLDPASMDHVGSIPASPAALFFPLRTGSTAK